MRGRAAESLRVDRFVLPFGDRGVLLHFLEHLFVAHSARERLGRIVARAGLALGSPSVAGRLLPGSEAVSTDGPHPDGCFAEDHLRRAADRLELEPGARWIQLLDYAAVDRSGRVLFAFPPAETEPSMVVKVRPLSPGGPTLKGEWEALTEVRARLPAGLASTVPEPLTYVVDEDTELLSLSFLPGCSVYADMRNLLLPTRRLASHMEAASTWLAGLHEATADAGTALDPQRDLPDPTELRERILAAGGAGALDGDPELRWYRSLCEGLVRRGLPLSAIHGDFWPRNLLLGSAPLPNVVDWEHYRRRGNPASDLFHFPLTYGLNHGWVRYRRRPPLEAFRRTFLDRNRVSRAVRDYLSRYGRIRGIDPDLLRHLFLLHLLTRGSRERSGMEAVSRALPEETLWVSAYSMVTRTRSSVFSW